MKFKGIAINTEKEVIGTGVAKCSNMLTFIKNGEAVKVDNVYFMFYDEVDWVDSCELSSGNFNFVYGDSIEVIND